MRRLLIVYNPRSSHFWQVRQDVLDRTHELKGWMVGKYEIADTDVDENAGRLSKLIADDDLVIAAGGDGTANIALNGVLLSGRRNVKFGVLGYGNFNDMARTFGMMKFDDILHGKVIEAWPLECKINGEHWRYAMCYVTAGMFAEACAVFDHPKVRKRLQKGKKIRRKHLVSSIWSLALWWLRNKRRKFLPGFALGNSSQEAIKCVGYSDYMAINSPTVARIMKGGKYYEQNDYFLSNVGVMTKFRKLIPMMMKSMLKQVPGVESDYDCLILAKASKIMLQAEGEYKMLSDVKMIEIEKVAAPLKVVVKK